MGDNSMFYDDDKKLSDKSLRGLSRVSTVDIGPILSKVNNSFSVKVKNDSIIELIIPEFTGYGVKEVIKGVVPSKSNSYRIVTIKSKDPLKKGFSSLAKTKEAKAYETAFILQCRKYRNANIDCEFNFEMDVYYPSRRADLDGSLKGILDCLQKANAIKNDNKANQLLIRRHIDKDNPRVEFSITKANQ